MARSETTKATHAGAIAVRKDQDAPRVLLISAKKTPSNWIFPKGHIERGESAEAAALRELREEAGVTGPSLGFLGTVTMGGRAEPVVTDYYLVRYEATVDDGEGRKRRWCTYDEALKLLSYAETRELLAASIESISRRLEST